MISILPSSCSSRASAAHQGLADLDTAPRQMPAGDVAVLDQKHPAGTIDNECTHPNRKPACEAPIEMQEASQERLERPANGIKLHVSKLQPTEGKPTRIRIRSPAGLKCLIVTGGAPTAPLASNLEAF